MVGLFIFILISLFLQMTEDYAEIYILKDRYLIGDFLDSGSNAVLYDLQDLKNTQTPLVIKLSQDI